MSMHLSHLLHSSNFAKPQLQSLGPDQSMITLDYDYDNFTHQQQCEFYLVVSMLSMHRPESVWALWQVCSYTASIMYRTPRPETRAQVQSSVPGWVLARKALVRVLADRLCFGFNFITDTVWSLPSPQSFPDLSPVLWESEPNYKIWIVFSLIVNSAGVTKSDVELQNLIFMRKAKLDVRDWILWWTNIKYKYVACVFLIDN